jgi:hypothetical protein
MMLMMMRVGMMITMMMMKIDDIGAAADLPHVYHMLPC